jgi:hypothetical protein
MSNYEIKSLPELLRENSYPGRGIVVGTSPDGKKIVTIYFIMGRSENSRNRIFKDYGDDVHTEPFDPAKVEDPSLIIYAPVRVYENHIIVTNGDQTDTIYDGLCEGKSFSESLRTRTFEPDAPNLTPRISAMTTVEGGSFTYQMSILKSADPEGTATNRFTYEYPSIPGVGHFIHTYESNGNPLPSFIGEPVLVALEGDMQLFSDEIWSALNADNKISLFVRYTEIETGAYCDVITNKNSAENA